MSKNCRVEKKLPSGYVTANWIQTYRHRSPEWLRKHVNAGRISTGRNELSKRMFYKLEDVDKLLNRFIMCDKGSE